MVGGNRSKTEVNREREGGWLAQAWIKGGYEGMRRGKKRKKMGVKKGIKYKKKHRISEEEIIRIFWGGKRIVSKRKKGRKGTKAKSLMNKGGILFFCCKTDQSS